MNAIRDGKFARAWYLKRYDTSTRDDFELALQGEFIARSRNGTPIEDEKAYREGFIAGWNGDK